MKTQSQIKQIKTKAKLKQIEGILSLYALVYTLLAIAIMLTLGLRHINDLDDYGQRWGLYALYHSGLGLIGFFTMLLFSKGKIRKVNRDTINYMFLTIILIVGSQILIASIQGYLPFSITTTEKALYHLFSSQTEESFFRGFILTIFCYWNKNIILKGVGVVISGISFALFHQQYWNNLPILIAIGIGGSCIAVVFLLSKFDYTAISLGHFLYNFVLTIKDVSQIIV